MTHGASRQAAPVPDSTDLADRLHSAAIHLLRRLRLEDTAAGLSAPRLSALSVIVFRGPVTLSELAQAEQVRPPTITRLVQGLETAGLVVRIPDSSDRRVTRIRATARGRRLLEAGRSRRVERLAVDLATLSPEDRLILRKATVRLEQLLRDTAR